MIRSVRTLVATTRSWFQDHIFKRLFKNASWLMLGNAMAGVIGLGTMALTARILDPAGFGLLALMATYTAIVDRLFNFQTTQAFIKYGTEAIEHGDKKKLRQLVKFCTLLDTGSACISTIVAMFGVRFIAGFLDLDAQQAHWLVLYSLVIFFNLSGVPTGVLRIFDRFYVLSFYRVLTAVLSFIGVGIIWYGKWGLQGFLLSMALSQIVGQLFLLGAGWIALSREKVGPVWTTSLKGIAAEAKNIWHFVFYTNIESSVKILRDLDIYIIKVLLSTEAVGLYRIARKLAEVLNLVIDPFFYAIYPEFSKYVARNDKESFVKLIKRSSLFVGIPMVVVWVGFLVLGYPFINVVFGETYLSSYGITLLCMAGIVAWGFFQSLPAALFSLGEYKKVFQINVSVAFAYMVLLYFFTLQWGLKGASLAFMMLYVVQGLLNIVVLKHKLSSK